MFTLTSNMKDAKSKNAPALPKGTKKKKATQGDFESLPAKIL